MVSADEWKYADEKHKELSWEFFVKRDRIFHLLFPYVYFYCIAKVYSNIFNGVEYKNVELLK